MSTGVRLPAPGGAAALGGWGTDPEGQEGQLRVLRLGPLNAAVSCASCPNHLWVQRRGLHGPEAGLGDGRSARRPA